METVIDARIQRQLNSILTSYLDEVTDHVIGEAVHTDRSDVAVVEEPRRIGVG